MRALTRSLTFIALMLPLGLAAQSYGNLASTPGPPPPPPTEAFATLADMPATHSGFVFDRAMLQVASSLLESNGMEPQRAAAALTAISFDTYRYQQPAFYSPEAMQALIETYRVAGWKHMVNANHTPQNTAQPRQMVTDLWLHFSGADIDGLTVLTRSPRDMNVVQVHGDLRPLDLLHLGGHFGIPKVDPSAVMVPAP
jgi:hypothetical protein